MFSRAFLFPEILPCKIFKGLYVTKKWHFWKSVLRLTLIIYDKNSAKASADDQTEAYKQAEEEMEKKAANDSALLVQVQQRVQSLLEDYVKNMGEVLGKEYTITWDIKENHVKSDTAESTE